MPVIVPFGMAGTVQQAVHSLINKNQHIEALLREACDDVNPSCKSNPTPPHNADENWSTVTNADSLDVSVSACRSYIQAQSHISSLPVSTVAALTCARELARLQQTTPEDDAEKRKSEYCLLVVMKELASQQSINRAIFLQELSLKSKGLPLELLWQLHTSSVLPLDLYIEHNSASAVVKHQIIQHVVSLCAKLKSVDENNSNILRGVLELLLSCAYSKLDDVTPMDRGLSMVTQDILDRIMKALMMQETKGHVVGDVLQIIRCHPSIDKDTISRFSVNQLESVLQCHPDNDPALTDVRTAVARQHDHWVYGKAPKCLTQMFTQLLLTVKQRQVCSLLQNALHEDKISWQNLLILVSVFCVCFKGGGSHISDLITDLLGEFVQTSNPRLLYAAFLLARQAAAEGSCDFPTYPQWFEAQFGRASSPHTTSSKSFTVFMESLTSLVPYEPVHCLKAHVRHPPHVPYKCQEILQDYIILAKTRLADFKENWQSSDKTKTNGRENAQQAVEEVEIAVSTFEKTGRIPKNVLQHSIFKRPYYMGQFLPALLTPRVVTDLLVGCHCKTLLLTAKSKASFSSIIAEHFACMFAKEPALQLPVYYRLFTLICHQGLSLTADHITGLASLLVQVASLGRRLPLVKLRTPSKHMCTLRMQEVGPDSMSLLNLISATLPLYTGSEMNFALKFLTVVVTSATLLPESSQDSVISQDLMHKVCYLWPRLHPTYRPGHAPDTGLPASVMSSTDVCQESVRMYTKFEQLLGTQDLSSIQSRFERWLHSEMTVDCQNDCLTLTQRKDYYHWILYSCTLPKLMQALDEDDPSQAHMAASTAILHAMLDHSSEVTVADEHCPHKAKNSQAGPGSHRRGANLWQEGIQLIQELHRVWSSGPSLPSNHQWLLTKLLARLSHLAGQNSLQADDLGQEMTISLEVANQVRLLQCLPPYLLLTDCLSLMPTSQAVASLTHYINAHLKEHMQEYYRAFGYGTVVIIVQGVLQLATHMAKMNDGQLQDVVAIVDRLLIQCPLLTLSILKHWDLLSPVINRRDLPVHVEGALHSRLFARLREIQALVHVESRGQQGAVPVEPHSNLFANPETFVIVVCGICSLHCRETTSVEQLQQLPETLICKLGHTSVRHHSVSANCGTILCAQSVSSDWLQTPTVSTIVHRLGTDRHLLVTILAMYTSLVTLHCQTDTHWSDQDGSAAGYQQIVSLTFLQSCLGLVQRVVAGSSCESLAAAESSLTSIDPEVRSLIAQRLQARNHTTTQE